jgi:hypothetical protein
MQIDLLLRPRPRRTKLIIAAVLSLATAAFLLSIALRNQKATERAEAALQLAQRAQPRPAPRKMRPEEIEEARKWTTMRAELSFSWYPIFRALENANSTEIELLEFVPDKVGKHLVLRGEARDQAALVSYTRTLAQQPVFSKLYLAHQKIEHRQGIDVFAFEIRSEIAE